MLGVGGVTDALTTGGFKAGWSLVRRLPERAAYALFDSLAYATYTRGGSGVRRLRANYARVRPEATEAELQQLTLAGVRSYLRYWCEAFRLPELSRDEILARVRVEGDGPVRAALAEGRAVVAFLGHMGNWDLAGAWGTLDLAPVVTVAERLKPEEVYEEFVGFRESLGMRILPLTGGGPVFEALRRAAKEPVIIPLLSDRDLTRAGICVTFLGHEASMAPGPAALAIATGSPLHPVSIRYEAAPDLPGGWRTVIHFHDAVADPGTGPTRDRVTAMTQACADVLSEQIRAHLVDWHMMQPLFEVDLDPARRRR